CDEMFSRVALAENDSVCRTHRAHPRTTQAGHHPSALHARSCDRTNSGPATLRRQMGKGRQCGWLGVVSALALLVGCSGTDTGSSGGVDSGSLAGELEVLVSDYETWEEQTVMLRTATGERVELVFEQAPDLVTGDRIVARGFDLDDERFRVTAFELVQSDVGKTQQELVGAPVLRRQRVALLLVNWSGPDATTVASATSTLTTGTSSTRNNFLESSYGQQDVSGDVYGWFTIPAPNGCDYSSIRNTADAAAGAAGVDLSAYQHVAYYFPRTSACSWSGLGSVGSPTR